jgi:hypothetical protein
MLSGSPPFQKARKGSNLAVNQSFKSEKEMEVRGRSLCGWSASGSFFLMFSLKCRPQQLPFHQDLL